MPIAQMILDMRRALLRKLIPQVIISTFATVLVSTILPAVTNSPPSVTPDSARSPAQQEESTYNYGELATLDTREPLAHFLERVALTHVAALKEPAKAAKQTANSAAEEPKSAPTVPLPPPRRSATPRQEPGSSKPHLAHSAAKTLPSQPPPPPIVPAVASEPAEEKPFLPLQYGMRLATNLQNIISASNSFVVAIAASMGDALTSVAKKL
jgi:hypothetical protein